ncbi:hypothetical protein [Streptomyces avermitilis]|uniref:hypothetical protein n=1 Tax=Streptomyces avermitilis TaxID=33903 RepID=UPI0033A27739
MNLGHVTLNTAQTLRRPTAATRPPARKPPVRVRAAADTESEAALTATSAGEALSV